MKRDPDHNRLITQLRAGEQCVGDRHGYEDKASQLNSIIVIHELAS